MLGGGYRGGTGARKNHADLRDFLTDDFERVEKGSARDDRGSVLVVVEDRNLHRLPERLLDVETVRGANVLEVDAADRRLEQLAELDHVVGILGPDLEIEHIEIGELLEEICLSLHHRLSRQRADVAQSQNGGAVGDDRNEVALGCVLVDVVGLRLDLEAGDRDPGRIGEREVALVVEGLGRYYRDLSGAAGRVVVEGFFTLH